MSTKRNPKIPYVTRELLEWLQEQFPDRSPLLSDHDREVWHKVGQVSVVRHLRTLYEKQETG